MDNSQIQYYKGLTRQLQTNLTNALKRIERLEEITETEFNAKQQGITPSQSESIPTDWVQIHDHSSEEQGGGTLNLTGFTKLGLDSPAIKIKVFTGTIPIGGLVSYPDGITKEKILFLQVMVKSPISYIYSVSLQGFIANDYLIYLPGLTLYYGYNYKVLLLIEE